MLPSLFSLPSKFSFKPSQKLTMNSFLVDLLHPKVLYFRLLKGGKVVKRGYWQRRRRRRLRRQFWRRQRRRRYQRDQGILDNLGKDNFPNKYIQYTYIPLFIFLSYSSPDLLVWLPAEPSRPPVCPRDSPGIKRLE